MCAENVADAAASIGGATAATMAPLVTGLIALALIGVFAWPLQHLLTAAATIVGTS